MTRPRRVVCVAFMGGLVVRRRPKDPVLDGGIPSDFVGFDPDVWPGESDYERWLAWDESRSTWAEANLPNGPKGLPGWDVCRFASMPDAPFDPKEI